MYLGVKLCLYILKGNRLKYNKLHDPDIFGNIEMGNPIHSNSLDDTPGLMKTYRIDRFLYRFKR